MIEAVGHHQTRFRLPGLGADVRGIALGERGLLLFASLDRLVAFIRAYSELESLDELIPSLELHQVVTPLRSLEFTVTILAESSYRMDRIAELARMVRGHCYTGSGRFFVRYRDAQAPFGYDLASAVDTAGDRATERSSDLVIHDATFSQHYRFQKSLSLQGLLYRLRLRPVPSFRRVEPDSYWASVEPGLFRPLMRHLLRARVEAKAGSYEVVAGSAFQARGAYQLLLKLEPPPDRIVRLLLGVPGICLFSQVSDRVAVETGYQHPVALESCGAAFDEGSLQLFRADGRVERLPQTPLLTPITALVAKPPMATGDTAQMKTGLLDDEFSHNVKLQVAPAAFESRRADAAVVASSLWSRLARMIHALPPGILDGLELAMAGELVVVRSKQGLEGLPIGDYFQEQTPNLFVPRGMKLSPALSPAALLEVIPDLHRVCVFMRQHDPPWLIPAPSFGPVSRWSLLDSPVALEVASINTTDPPLQPTFGYGGRPFGAGFAVKHPGASEMKKG